MNEHPDAPLIPARNIPNGDIMQADAFREDVVAFVRQFIHEYNHQRGPFEIRENAQTQQLPGVTVPSWLAMAISQLTSHPMLPYNNDRPALLRDMLFLACAGMFNALNNDLPGRDGDDVRAMVHIIRHEETLRRSLFVEELLLNYTEDLTIAAQVLALKVNMGAKAEVFNTLKDLFNHALQAPSEFWRSTILSLMFRCEEVVAALQYLNTDWSYLTDQEVQHWGQLYHDEVTRED